MNSIYQPIMVSFLESIFILGGLILCGFLLGFLEKETDRNLMQRFGQTGVLLTSLLGTPVHEIGHAAMALLFGHKITKIKLLQVNHPNGVLGYVEHSYNPKNFYQRVGNFFIALGPIFSGTASLFAAMYFLLPKTFRLMTGSLSGVRHLKFSIQDFGLYLWKNFKALFSSLFTLTNFHHVYFWIFLVIAVSISSHIALSSKDLEGMWDGFLVAFLAVFAIHFLVYEFGNHGIPEIMFYLQYGSFWILYLLSVSIMLSVIAWLISFVISIL